MADAGLIVLTAFISPFRAEREMVRAMLPEGEFVEIFVDTPLAEAEKRDVKGLYAKARAGELPNFTGIDSPYEAPEHPEIRIDTTAMTAEQAADMIVAELSRPSEGVAPAPLDQCWRPPTSIHDRQSKSPIGAVSTRHRKLDRRGRRRSAT